MNLKCRNIKINVILAKALDWELIDKQKLSITDKRSCFTIRTIYSDWVITVYKHSTTSLHITGIKSTSMVIEVFQFISTVLKMAVLSSKINNSMFCGKFDHHVNISYIIKRIGKSAFYTCTFCEEIFPACFIKGTKEKKREGFPTILLFPNGSYIIMGAKNIQSVKNAYMFLNVVHH